MPQTPGMERQPSWKSIFVFEVEMILGLMKACGPFLVSAMMMRTFSPICGAAIPMPFSAAMVSIMLSMRVWIFSD